MKDIEDFKQYYKGTLRPILEELEIRRKSIVTKLTIVICIVAIASGVGGILAMQRTGDLGGLIIAGIIGLVVMAGFWWLLTHKFRGEFKGLVIQNIVTYVDPELVYSPDDYIQREVFQQSTLFQHRIDRYKGEDLIYGKLDKTAIRFSEIHAEYKTTTTDSKGRRQTHWHTIFKGVFFVADFNKHFSGRTVVLPDTAQKLFGRLGQKLQSWNLAREDLVALEDPEFEKEFVVYGSDQVEARYILSTSLMRRILEFRRKLRVPVFLGFVNSSVYIAIDTKKNMFEPRLFRSLLDFSLVEEYLQDLLLTVGIVDDLNLNTRIWTKQ